MIPDIRNLEGEPIDITGVTTFFVFCPKHSASTNLTKYCSLQLKRYANINDVHKGILTPDDDGAAQERSTSCGIFSICNPYRYAGAAIRMLPGNEGWTDCGELAASWASNAIQLIEAMDRYPHIPLISYERFVSNPRVINNAFGITPIEIPPTEFLRKTSDYVQKVAFLTPSEVMDITYALRRHQDVLDFFSYDLRGYGMLEEARSLNPGDFNMGIERRIFHETNKAVRDIGKQGHDH